MKLDRAGRILFTLVLVFSLLNTGVAYLVHEKNLTRYKYQNVSVFGIDSYNVEVGDYVIIHLDDDYVLGEVKRVYDNQYMIATTNPCWYKIDKEYCTQKVLFMHKKPETKYV